MDARPGEGKLARMRSHAQPQPRLSSPTNAVSKLHPYQVALSRPTPCRYRSSSLKNTPDAAVVRGEHTATFTGGCAPHRQVHTPESHLSRTKHRDGRCSISPQLDSNPRSHRPPGSPASPRSTREQLAAALEKAVKACSAENPHSEAPASIKGPSRFLRSQGISRGGSSGKWRETPEKGGDQAGVGTDRCQSSGQRQLEVCKSSAVCDNAAGNRVPGAVARTGDGDAADQLSTVQIQAQTSLGNQNQLHMFAAAYHDLQVRAATAEGCATGSRALHQERSSWDESVDSSSTPLGDSKPVVRVGKTVVPSFHGRHKVSPTTGLPGAGEGLAQVLTVHGTDANSAVHSTCRSVPLSSRFRTPESRVLNRPSMNGLGDTKGSHSTEKHGMRRPTNAPPPKRSVPRCVTSKASARMGGSDGNGTSREACAADQSKMAPLQFNSQGVAVVANMPDTGQCAQSGIQEEPQAADPGVHGLSLLEYMDLIASEETVDEGQNRTVDDSWMEESWMKSKLHGTDTANSESSDKCACGDQDIVGSLSALATDRTCTPAARGGTDIPARADSSICRRHDSHMCQPLANRFSNLPDVELRPGTAACHAFGGNGDSSDGPRYHDPAFSVTHVSLADMAPNLFTAKDHDSSGSTPRCQRSTATSSAAIGGVSEFAPAQWASMGSEWQQQSHDREASEEEGDDTDTQEQAGALADVKQKSGMRLVQSARPMSPNEPVLDETVWTKQALKRPPSRQKPPPEALHLFSEGGAVWKSHGGVRRPQTAMGLSHRCSVLSGHSLPAVIPLTATARPISRHRPPPENLDCFTDVTQ